MGLKAMGAMATRRDVIKGTLKAGAYAAPIIAAGAVPFAVGAVTAPGGFRLLINGANSATLGLASPFTLTGQGFTPGSTVFRIFQRNFSSTGILFSFLPLTVGANGTFTDTENTTGVNAILSNGPGSYTVSIATTVTSTATTFSFSGVLVSLPVIVTGASGAFTPAATPPTTNAVQD